MSSNSAALKQQLDSTSQQLLSIQKTIEERIFELKYLEQSWEAKCKIIEENAKKVQSILKLDVGGQVFKTTKETLLSQKDTFFYAMLSSGNWLPDEDGCYFIDRNPALFSYILDYLRNGKVDLSGLDSNQLEQLEIEVDYYLISDMISSSGDKFDPLIAGSNIKLSDKGKTATVSVDGSHGLIGMKGISSGIHTWALKINNLSPPWDWLMLGVVSKPFSSLKEYFNNNIIGLATNRQKFTNGATDASPKNCNWLSGTIIRITLDLAQQTLTITDSNMMEQWYNIPLGTYHLYINFNNTNNSITIIDPSTANQSTTQQHSSESLFF